MPTLRTPLFGSYNRRNEQTLGSKDQLFKACLLTRIVNNQSRTATYYVEKRGGLNGVSTPATGQSGLGVYISKATGTRYSLFYSTPNATLYSGTTNCGVLDSVANSIVNYWNEVTLNNITYILLVTPVGGGLVSGWYLASDAVSTTAYTCNGNNSTTITNIKIAGVNSVAGLYIGQKLTAASNIVAGSRIVSINAGAFSAVLDTATTGGAFTDLATTKEPVAKMNDADFPSNAIGGFVVKDGYVLIMTTDQKVYNSDLNSISSWTASNYLTCNKFAGLGCTVVAYRDRVAAFSNGSIEFLYNAGNASGSPFSSDSNAIKTSDSAMKSAARVPAIAGNTVYWWGNDNCLYELEGTAPKKLGTIGNGWTATSIHTSAFTKNNKTYLNSVDTSRKNIWYCIDDGNFVEPSFATTANTAGVATTDGIDGYFVMVDTDTSGKVYQLTSNGTFTDNSVAFTMSIQLATDMGTNKRKFPSELRLICDVQSSGAISVSYSDDDGANFSTAITMPVTSIAEMFIPGSMLGSWEGTRLWKFEDAGNNPQRIKMLEIDYTVEA